jgi:hypothetical protein
MTVLCRAMTPGRLAGDVMTFSIAIRSAVAAGAVATLLAGTAAAQSTVSSAPEQVTSSRRNEIPVGQELDVRLQTLLDSETAQVEDRFEATTVVDLMQGDRVLVPAGSHVRGIISAVDRASRTDRTGELTLAFDEIVVHGRSYPLRANAVDTIKSEGIKGEVGKIAAGAGVGAIVGGILGGTKGAIAGILIGAGGTIAATEGNDVELPAGTVLRLRLDEAVFVNR